MEPDSSFPAQTLKFGRFCALPAWWETYPSPPVWFPALFSLSEDSWDFTIGVGTQEFTCVMVGCGIRDFDFVSFEREEKSKLQSFLTLREQLLKFQLKAVMGAQGGSVP